VDQFDIEGKLFIPTLIVTIFEKDPILDLLKRIEEYGYDALLSSKINEQRRDLKWRKEKRETRMSTVWEEGEKKDKY